MTIQRLAVNQDEYQTKVRVYKAELTDATDDWDRLKNDPVSQDKLKALQNYIRRIVEYEFILVLWPPLTNYIG